MDKRRIDGLLRLDGPGRYEHLVKRAADTQRLFGLWLGGWALYGDAEGRECFPVWPDPEFAELLASDDWNEFKPRDILLADVHASLLPALRERTTFIAAFPTPESAAVVIDPDGFEADLRSEQKRY